MQKRLSLGTAWPTRRLDDAGSEMAKRFIRADMAKIALDNGSVISAALFGAKRRVLNCLVQKHQFHETIKASVGVDASIATFDAAYAEIQNPTPVSPESLSQNLQFDRWYRGRPGGLPIREASMASSPDRTRCWQRVSKLWLIIKTWNMAESI